METSINTFKFRAGKKVQNSILKNPEISPGLL